MRAKVETRQQIRLKFWTTRLLFGSSVKIRCNKHLQIAASWTTSRRVTWRFWRNTARTISTWSSSVNVEYRTDLGSPSKDDLTDLKRLYQSWQSVRFKKYAANGCCNIWKSSVNVFPYLKRNLTQTPCSSKSYNYQLAKTRRQYWTHSHSRSV